ncbi:unnamed protein product [Schistosoma rodhaini]|uniref:Uncharacterized protein n=1 Tax=Schistosoma rodhaini TaxID=6188 RepID=A0AA85FNJ8_9TREM|nr:unnamed protein product [Schistosoma rodhaini]CAH8568233.1 unnamed protein product [Schistosoma rodhaini]
MFSNKQVNKIIFPYSIYLCILLIISVECRNMNKHCDRKSRNRPILEPDELSIMVDKPGSDEINNKGIPMANDEMNDIPIRFFG